MGLRALSQKFPAQNEKVAKGLQEAETLKMQQQVAGLQPGAALTSAQLGGQAAASVGQKAQASLQASQQTMAQQQQVGELELQKQGMQRQKALGDKKLALDQQHREAQDKLFNFSEGKKQELYDQNLQFQKDELGRSFFNERQLADWALTKAKSKEEMLNYEQRVTQLHKRKSQMLKQSYKVLEQRLFQEMEKGEQDRDQELTKNIMNAKNALEKKMQQDAAEASNRAAMFSTIGTLVGGAAGAALGGAVGAQIGSSAGGGAGGMVGGAVNKSSGSTSKPNYSRVTKK